MDGERRARRYYVAMYIVYVGVVEGGGYNASRGNKTSRDLQMAVSWNRRSALTGQVRRQVWARDGRQLN